MSFTTEDFKSLLFYFGLLTIKTEEFGELVLQIPNAVIKGLYFDFIASVIQKDINFKIDLNIVKKSFIDISELGNCTQFIQLIEEFLHLLSNKDFIKFDEKYIKLVMAVYANMSPIFHMVTELEVEDGYIDLALMPLPTVQSKHYAIFEIKYLKVGDFSETLADEKIKEAEKQLLRYSQSERISGLPGLKRWALVFAGDKCVRCKEITDVLHV